MCLMICVFLVLTSGAPRDTMKWEAVSGRRKLERSNIVNCLTIFVLEFVKSLTMFAAKN